MADAARFTLGDIRRRKEEIRKQNEIKVVSDVVYLGTQRRNGEEKKGYGFNGDVQNKK